MRNIPLQQDWSKLFSYRSMDKEIKYESDNSLQTHPSYCIVTVLPMSANLRSSKIKKLCLSAIFSEMETKLSQIYLIEELELHIG